MAKEEKPKYKITIDLQCGACGAMTHLQGEVFPKFCPCCGAALERFCLTCQKKAEMFFEEWWPEDDECVRTYTTPRRCTRCNAVLESGAEHPGGTDEESE